MRATMLSCLTAIPLLTAVAPALADAPRVAVDIAPVHALVAQVMAGVGEPDLVVPPGASPHGHAMRPSEARALQDADLVVWVGPDLTPWLAAPIDALAEGTARLTLLEVPGIRRLDFRQDANFEVHDHAHDDHAHDDHAHDDHAHDDHAHDDHAHDDHAHDDHEDHAHGDQDDHAHDHSGTDPHAWLDPANAAIWLDSIARELARLDPDNAAAYAANAAEARADLDLLQARLAARLEPLSGGFIVFHDAYQYFEARFGLAASGALSLSDAAPPGPARVAQIRDRVAAEGIACVFVEPQFNRGMVDAVFEGSGVRVSVIDPLGADLTPGPAHYAAVLEGMAAAFETCLGPS